jgi:cyclic pyranopterin phosphate synthase
MADVRPDLHDALGRPLRDLRLSVIEACNFRCPYCMPAEQVADDYGLDAASRLSFDEMETLVRGFVQAGVTKLRLTGGEPLLRKRLPELIARLAASLDALDPALFKELSGGRGEVAHVLKGIEAAQAAGFGPIKLNCVVQRGINEGEVLPLVEFARSHGHIIRFIEYMDVGTCNGWRRERVVPSAELRDRIQAQWPLQPLGAQYRGEVASRYGFADGRGEVGFVSSVSEPFCGDCHRARVSADGRLYTCLFAAEGHDLRPVLPLGQEAVARHLAERWSRRSDRYSELRGSAKAQRKHVEMYLVGG